MLHASKLKYTQLFNNNDRNKRGTLTGRDWFYMQGISV